MQSMIVYEGIDVYKPYVTTSVTTGVNYFAASKVATRTGALLSGNMSGTTHRRDTKEHRDRTYTATRYI